jgi:outer membrane cobalamin receptor
MPRSATHSPVPTPQVDPATTPRKLAAENTVITVSAEAIPVSATSASVTIVPREVIQNSHTELVSDLLRQQPFLYLTQTGSRGGLTTITLRGAKPNLVLVMVDGIP